MKTKTQNLLSGAGSLIDVFAASRYRELLPESTAEEIIRGHCGFCNWTLLFLLMSLRT